MLGFVNDPFHYFSEFEEIINSIFLWIRIGFIVLNIGAFIFCMIRNKERVRDFGCALWINTLSILVIFGVACSFFGIGKFFGEQDYNIAGYYYGTLSKEIWFLTMTSILTGIAGIVAFITIIKSGHIFLAILGAIFGGGLFFAVMYFGVFFVIYVIIYFVWLILRMIWIILSTFGVSIYSFSKQHWIILTATFGGPAVLYGLLVAVMDYWASFKWNVGSVKTGKPLFNESSSSTSSKKGKAKVKNNEIEDALV